MNLWCGKRPRFSDLWIWVAKLPKWIHIKNVFQKQITPAIDGFNPSYLMVRPAPPLSMRIKLMAHCRRGIHFCIKHLEQHPFSNTCATKAPSPASCSNPQQPATAWTAPSKAKAAQQTAPNSETSSQAEHLRSAGWNYSILRPSRMWASCDNNYNS